MTDEELIEENLDLQEEIRNLNLALEDERNLAKILREESFWEKIRWNVSGFLVFAVAYPILMLAGLIQGCTEGRKDE